jgi:glycosyltransferase involved in cell wall biosynthesis
MLTFSLIVATLGRTRELENLFESLASQAYPNLECIIVDQNPDRRVKEIVDLWKDVLKLRVIDSAPGLSRARNVGLTAATGDILAFPDDDCWYSQSLLACVSGWFEDHAEYGVLTRRELRERAPRIVLGGAAFLLTPQFGRELGAAETAIDLRHALTMLCA